MKFAGAVVVCNGSADRVHQFAAAELSRFLYLLTGVESSLAESLPGKAAAVVLQNAGASSGGQGYTIRASSCDQRDVLVIDADTSRGLLHGVYRLLEELGMGFYLGGETLPDESVDVSLPADFELTERPAFAVRGNLLHDNTLVGITTWGLDDWNVYLTDLARMRCNTVLTCWYNNDCEPLGPLQTLKPIMSTLTRKWGSTASRTSQFAFGSGDCFHGEIFSSPAGETLTDPTEQRWETVNVFSEAMRLAKLRGIDVACGLTAPVGDVKSPVDAEDPTVRALFEARIQRFLEHYPHLSYFVLYNHESGGCAATTPPPVGTPGHKLYEQRRDAYAYLGNPRRVWEAIRFGRFAEIAYEVVQDAAPHVRLVVSGWGGDRWMCFADYCLAYDKLLPPNVIFTCHDNIDASVSRTVSAAWGDLQPQRERWAVPWVEEDGSDFWSPQPNVESLQHLAPDALRKGCQGLLTMQWRTRDLEEEAGYSARFAWEPELTPESFYRRLASDAFGPDREPLMAKHLWTLQKLGRRWTGVPGTPEIGEMIFAGWKPHLPFELGAEAGQFLVPFAHRARQALAESFAADAAFRGADDVALFQQVHEDVGVDAQLTDPTQLGVSEFTQVIETLEGLLDESDTARIRAELQTLEEMVYGLRAKLIHRWMPANQFSAVDLFLIATRHLIRNAGVERRMAVLTQVRDDLAGLRDNFVREGRLGRLERLDYLAANIDFVTHYDQVAMLLADGEAVPRAIEEAERLHRDGEAEKAAAVATEAYGKLISAGMREAVLALTRKLSTRCEFAILATVNIKPVPVYLEFVRRLEALMPAAPPGEVDADEDGLRLVAPRPPSVCEAGQTLTIRVVVLGPLDIASVDLHCRAGVTGSWQTTPMTHRCRRSYQAVVPIGLDAGIVTFFVEASDDAGAQVFWPATAGQGRPWTVMVVER
tara:strand:+ start:1423 stop:4218 length:2796 start_codon:yes stop_codon:yes gene_type:complete